MSAAGRAWISIEEVAICYEVEVAWVREVHAAGLLELRREDGVELLPAIALERVAVIVRWSRALGLDLEAIAALL